MNVILRKSRHPIKVPTRASTPPKPFPGRHFGWAVLRPSAKNAR